MSQAVQTVKDPVGYPDFTRPVSITGYTITSLPIDIVAQTITTLAVDITAQTLAQLNVNIAASAVTLSVDITAQTLAQLNVNIAAQAVDLNIKTAGGTNIVIDQLTQGAFTERRFTAENRGDTATMASDNLYRKKGKFFPRGMRGFIFNIQVYVENADVVDHYIFVKVSPAPELGPVYEWTRTITARTAAGWYIFYPHVLWQYDSMFIMVGADVDIYIGLGYDTGTPYDAYHSGDFVGWWQVNRRYWFRVAISSATVGDLPVSGTLNTIQIPNVTSGFDYQYFAVVTGGATKDVLSTIYGVGKLNFLSVWTLLTAGTVDFADRVLGIVVDGQTFEVNLDQLSHALADTENTPTKVTLIDYDTAAWNVGVAINFPISFRRSLRVYIKNTAAAGNDITIHGFVSYELIA